MAIKLNITYDGITKTVEEGGTATIACAGKYAKSDIVFECVEAVKVLGDITINASATVVSSGTRIGFVLYNSNDEAQQTYSVNGGETKTIQFDNLENGSYIVATAYYDSLTSSDVINCEVSPTSYSKTKTITNIGVGASITIKYSTR